VRARSIKELKKIKAQADANKKKKRSVPAALAGGLLDVDGATVGEARELERVAPGKVAGLARHDSLRTFFKRKQQKHKKNSKKK
jgi:hypothetical protein